MNKSFASFITIFKTILKLWSETFGLESSGPKREPLLEYNGEDPWINMLQNDDDDEVLLWRCVEKDMNDPLIKRWTSYDYRNELRERYGSLAFGAVK